MVSLGYCIFGEGGSVERWMVLVFIMDGNIEITGMVIVFKGLMGCLMC